MCPTKTFAICGASNEKYHVYLCPLENVGITTSTPIFSQVLFQKNLLFQFFYIYTRMGDSMGDFKCFVLKKASMNLSSPRKFSS